MTMHRRALIRNMLILGSVNYVKPPFRLPAARSFSGEQDITLTNEYLACHFSKRGMTFGLTDFANRLSGKKTEIKSDDFSIGLDGAGPLTSRDFFFQKGREEKTSGIQVLHLHYQHPSKDIGLVITYQLGDHDFFLRRQLRLTTTQPLALRQVNVWELAFDDECIFQEDEPPQTVSAAFGFSGTRGFGLPVFMRDSFWGLEYPAGYNQFEQSKLTLAHFPGRTIVGSFLSKKAVLGVSAAGETSAWFKQYTETLLATPRAVRPLFVDYNTWTTLMPATEKNSIALISQFRQKLFDAHGVHMDSYTIDDGWDHKDSLWDIEQESFPNGFSPLLDALKPMDTKLGLWLSPSSGYDHAPWLGSQGYPRNGTWDWFMCQSDHRYSADLTKKVAGLTQKYGLNFFKFDGFCAVCNATDHPSHLPGNYSKEANVDAYIELLTVLRKVNPEIFLDPTSGMWLSPWWLQYADSVYGDMFDGVSPAIAPTPKPGYGHFITRDALFRKRIRDNASFPSNAIEHLGIYTPDYDTLYDEIIAVIGRGCRLLSIYLDPQLCLRTEEDWAFLAGALAWARSNAPVLWETQTILGDPLKREPYGYAHFLGEKGIVVFYNPFIESRNISLALDARSGWKETKKPQGIKDERTYLARVVYPYQQVIASDIRYGQSIDLLLAGHETLILQIEPVDFRAAALIGARHREARRIGKKIEYNIFGRAGREMPLFIKGLKSAKLQGEQSRSAVGETGKLLTFPGKAEPAAVENGSMALETANGKARLTGSCTAHIPEGSLAEMHILFSSVLPSGYQPQAEIKVDGRAAAFVISRPTLKPPHIQLFAELPVCDWCYISFKIPSGKREVSFFIDAPIYENGKFKAEAGCWLWMEHPLQTVKLTVEYPGTLPSPQIFPVAARNQWEREIITVCPNRAFSIGENLHSDNASIVYLDEILPEVVAMSEGQLQLNKSVKGTGLVIAGRRFTRGLGMQAYGRVRYDIAGKSFKRFSAFVGLNEDGGKALVIFEVWIDEKRVFASGTMNIGTAVKEINLDLTNAATLEIRTLTGADTDDLEGAHGNWCEARLTRQPAS